MNMKDEAELGLAVYWVQQALISAYEDNCPLRPVKTGRQSLWWTSELESLRRGVRWLFNKCQADNNPHRWELYREAQQRYRKEGRKASKQTWRAFCSSVNNLPRSARLRRAVSRDPKIRLGSLVAPSGERAQSEEETLDLLLVTHFPNSVAVEREALSAVPNVWTGRWLDLLLVTHFPNSVAVEREALSAVPNVWTGRWLRRLSPMGEWYGRLIHSPHMKVRVWIGYSRLCCKRDGRSLFLTWSRFFMPAW